MSKTQLLVEGNLVSVDSLRLIIEKYSITEFIDNHYKTASFEVNWDSGTSLESRKTTVKAVINGYLDSANELSDSIYGMKVCELNSMNLKALKNSYHFEIKLRDYIPPPPIQEIYTIVDTTSEIIDIPLDEF
jgi:hypothetical protein